MSSWLGPEEDGDEPLLLLFDEDEPFEVPLLLDELLETRRSEVLLVRTFGINDPTVV